LTTHPRPINQSALKHADVLIMTGLTQAPTVNPDTKLGELCMNVALTIRNNGSALIPCYPSGVVYDLFECLTQNLENAGLNNVPMFFISPVADSSLAYSNILAEWLSSAKQNKVYLPDDPFPHAFYLRNNKLKHYNHVFSEGFSKDFRQVNKHILAIGAFISIYFLFRSPAWFSVDIPACVSVTLCTSSKCGATIPITPSYSRSRTSPICKYLRLFSRSP